MYYSRIVGQVGLFKYLVKANNNKDELLDLCGYYTDTLAKSEKKRVRKPKSAGKK
jgi:hypothetical protein